MDFSIINYYGKDSSRCGYCKGTRSSEAHGMHAYNMFPQDYQELIDRGWRRSGHYCYKPYNKTTCCPCYTIKCDALEFKLSKSHKKILKRMNRFLRDGKKDKSEEEADLAANEADDAATDNSGGGGLQDEPKAPNVPIPEINMDAITAVNCQRTTDKEKERFEEQVQSTTAAKTNSLQVDDTAMSLASSGGSSVGGYKKSFDGQNPPCKKAKQMRLERRQAKLAAKGISPAMAAVAADNSTTNVEKSITDYIAEAGSSDKHTLKIVLMPSNKQNATDEAFNLYRKYQLIIHNDNPLRLTPTSLERFCYKSPLQYTKTHDGPTTGYGSFHQQYWLDDKLIAVGVIDILPYCVSSVYFFYDPDYSFLSLGTYGSLREIEFVQQLAAAVPALKYYYMGFYIHSCPKMRYKGKLVPSFLLCPETYTWNLLTDETRAKLNERKYQRLETNAVVRDANEFLENDLNQVLLLVQNNCITYRQFIQITGDDDDRNQILEYGRLVGKPCAHRMLYLKI